MKQVKQKLFIVTELFYPDETSTSYLLTKIASKLSEEYEVNVICSSNLYGSMKVSTCNYNELKNISIWTVKSFSLSKNNKIFRTLRLLFLSISLSVKLAFQLKKDDKVLIVTNPAPLLLLVSSLRSIRKFDYSILVHDVFPENAVAAEIISNQSRPFKILKSIFDKAYSKADRLIVLGRDMKDVVTQKTAGGSKVDIVENWAEKQLLDIEIPPKNNAEEMIIQYAGNIGRVQGLEMFVKCFQQANNSNLKLEFFGGGALEEMLIKYCSSNRISNVCFNGVYSRSEQAKIFARADMAIVSLAPNMYGLGVPSKTYNLIAAGIPILFIGDLKSEIALMIVEYKLGWCFDTKDSEGLINFMRVLSRKMLDTKDRNYIQKIAKMYYSESIILNKFQNVLNN